ncbi:hypothetical protein [Baaleninema sp.]|uniref:hypothetical protein n=1 Tax=Baaleninema sp. TaxID=3101197 RepID=UPI003D01A49F
MNDNFDEGLWCHSEAIFHYSNKNALDLQVEYYTEDRSLYFSFFDDSGDGMGLLFKFESSLSPLLDSITNSQDKLSLENYKQYIKQWVEIYPNAYVQYDDDLVLLTLD